MINDKFNLVRRVRNWKSSVEKRLSAQEDRIAALEQENRTLAREIKASSDELIMACRLLGSLTSERHHWLSRLLAASGAFCVYRSGTLSFIIVPDGIAVPAWCGGLSEKALFRLMDEDRVRRALVRTLQADGRLDTGEEVPGLLASLRDRPDEWRLVLKAIRLSMPPALTEMPEEARPDEARRFYKHAMDLLTKAPDLIDSLALGWGAHLFGLAGTETCPPPFDRPENLPPVFPATPKSRSVLFLHNSYYHFNTLAEALKRQGWDAVTVSVESPDSPQQQFYFGEDINLYHDDPTIRRRNIAEFFGKVPERFEALHFYGQGRPTFFEENSQNDGYQSTLPWDFLELRRHRTIIGYMPSGCLDGATQSAIRGISDDVCSRCVWERRPDVCSDERNRAWADMLDHLCDWIGIEGDWAVEDRVGSKFVRGPVVTALDPQYWTPALDIPEAMRLTRAPDEILICAAVGNLAERQKDGRDIKGVGAIKRAVAALQQKGLPLRFMLFTDVPIKQMRYYKAQADIVVDQLNYGRLGANARESFMLGKPLITRLSPAQQSPLSPLRFVAEAPALNASEETIEEVLGALATNPDKRRALAGQARNFALRWFADDVCAQRFETIIDRVRAGLAPETEDLYPAPMSALAEPAA